MNLNICCCGTQAGYPHDTDCPYPCYNSGIDATNWEIARLNNQNAQLLEALKYIMNWTPDNWNPETARDLARAAIAAAEGKG